MLFIHTVIKNRKAFKTCRIGTISSILMILTTTRPNPKPQSKPKKPPMTTINSLMTIIQHPKRNPNPYFPVSTPEAVPSPTNPSYKHLKPIHSQISHLEANKWLSRTLKRTLSKKSHNNQKSNSNQLKPAQNKSSPH